MKDNKELWEAVLAQVQFSISKANFATWFKNTGITSVKKGIITISVPNSFSKEWLEKKYHKIILKILKNIDASIKEIKYKIEEKTVKQPSIDYPQPSQLDNNFEQLRFSEFKGDKETNLNPNYTFDNFVIGSFNELSQAAAWAVSKNPGLTYNPLFIYGGVGLGKTHLLQATGNKIIESFENKKIKYISCEKFISGVVNSIRNHDIQSFKENLHSIDILIIDDIQFLSGKEKTQEEFFHIFNSLYEKNKQIILSSDRPPSAIPALEERLRSRFEGGMIADISVPDYETRLVILKTKLQEKNAELKPEVLDFIAENIKKNIRELEGSLNRLLIYKKINNKDPDRETAKNLLKSLIQSPFNVASVEKIIKTVASFYNLQEKYIFEATRRKEIVRPRQIAMFLLREELKNSFPFISKKFNGKDHTTAIYAYKKITKEISINNKLSEEIDLIKQKIYSG